MSQSFDSIQIALKSFKDLQSLQQYKYKVVLIWTGEPEPIALFKNRVSAQEYADFLNTKLPSWATYEHHEIQEINKGE